MLVRHIYLLSTKQNTCAYKIYLLFEYYRHKHTRYNYKIMGVFVSISNINSMINLGALIKMDVGVDRN